MSLVRVKKFHENLIIVGDTKLSYNPSNKDSLRENDPSLGTIKTILISDKICISFAGQVLHARKAIRKIIIDNVFELGRLKAILHDISIESYISGNKEDTVDFILCHCLDGKPSVIEIKEMEMKEVVQSWIGDKGGFDKYQETYLSECDMWSKMHEDNELRLIKIPDEFSEEESKLYLKMFDAMYSVIIDGSISSVGGFVIPVIFSNGSFKYDTYLSNIRKQFDYNEIEYDVTIPFGDVSIGSYLINISSGQHKYLAVFILQCKMGLVYKLDENYSMSPTVYSKFEEIEFNKMIEQEYGVTIELTVEATKEYFYYKGLNLIEENSYDAGYYMYKALKALIIELEKKYDRKLKRMSDLEALKLTIYELNFMTLCLYYMGVISYDLKKREKSINYLKKAVKLSPKFKDAKQFLDKLTIEEN